MEDPTNYDVTLDTKTRVAHHHASSVLSGEDNRNQEKEEEEEGENMQLPPNQIDEGGAAGIDLKSDGN